MSSRLFGFLVAAIATATAAAYDIGCIYPERAETDLFQVRRTVFWSLLGQEGFETPMVVHRSHECSMCAAACVAHHTPGMKDPLTLGRTRFTTPDFGHNGHSMIMCMAQCNTYISTNLDEYKERMENSNFPIELPSDRPDIRDAVATCPYDQRNCFGGCAAICNIVQSEDYHPYTIGHYLGNLMNNYFDNDGWNRQGNLQYSRTLDQPVPCTGSCRKYQNTISYAPRPNPRLTQPYNNETKYNCTGDCARWQPLQEGDDVGSLRQQEFVVPHIGTHATTYLREPTLDLELPDYDLYVDSLQVIEELRITSGDQYRKDAVQLFDNKLRVRSVIQDAILDQFAETREISFQEYMLYLAGISNPEHDSVVQAWAEKVRLDLVRPTTVIKYWGDDELLTYGGNRFENGPKLIKARDFEAFVRVMPHAEFPSGSAAICTAYMEFTDLYLTEQFGRSITNFKDAKGYTYDNMEHMRDICGESRLWGGMHYPQSIGAGEQIAEGLGALGVEWVRTFRNNAEFPNNWYRGDAGPVCGEA